MSRKFILVMGVTGAGKSHLIGKISNKPIKVGHSLESCTSEIEEVNVNHPDGSVVTLLDTPGFDDTNRSDTEILQLVTDRLYGMYTDDVKITGIIYVQRISDIRMQGVSLKNLNMFEKLCGDKTFKNVVLLTTRWDMVPDDIGDAREAELKGKYWKLMVRKGSEVMRYRDDADITKLMGHLLGQEGVNLLVQEELSEGKSLQDTGAGIVINRELVEAERKYKEELEEAKAMMRQALEEKDEETRAIIQEQADEMTEKIAKIQKDKEVLERNLREELASYRKQIDEAKEDRRRIEEENRRMEKENRDRLDRMQAEHREQQKRLEEESARIHDEMQRKIQEDRAHRKQQEEQMKKIHEDNMRTMERDREERKQAMEKNFAMEKEARERKEEEMRVMHKQQMDKMEKDREDRERRDREMEANHRQQMAAMEKEKQMKQAEMDRKFREQQELLERERLSKEKEQAEMDRKLREKEDLLKRERKNRTTISGLATSGVKWALKPATNTIRFIKEL